MANNPVHADRVRETTTSTGTGTIDLDGAVAGFQTFVAGVGDGEECSYAIIAVDGDGVPTGDWELGFGTVTDAATDTLSRTPYASSNAGSAVNFSAGTKQVFCTPGSRVFPEVGCQVKDAALSLISGVNTKASFDSENWDPFAMHDLATNPTRVTIAVPGRYMVMIHTSISSESQAGRRELQVWKNGVAETDQMLRTSGTLAVTNVISLVVFLELAASDYLEANIMQDSGSTLTASSTIFTVQRLTN